MRLDSALKKVVPNISRPKKSRQFLMKLPDNFQMRDIQGRAGLLHTGSGFQWYRTYKRGYETSGSLLRFMLRRSSLVECVSVLHGTCLQSVKIFFIHQ
jgi:hypothetical protein